MRKLCCVGVVLLAGALTGCSVEGQWALREVEPIDAREDVRFDKISLEPDGTYYAEIERDEDRTTSGTYTYRKNVLTLKDEGGETYYFDAQLKNAGRELELVRFWNGRKLQAQYMRQDG